MKRSVTWSRIAFVLVAVLVISGCTPVAPGGGAAATQAPIEIVVWAEGNTVNSVESDPEGQGKYGKYIVEKFEEEHPGIKVKLEYQATIDPTYEHVDQSGISDYKLLLREVEANGLMMTEALETCWL